MKIIIDVSSIEILIARMGAEASSWSPTTATMTPLDIFRAELEKGKEISIADLQIVHNGLLAVSGAGSVEQILLYIKDTRKDEFTLLNDSEQSPKFHVAECKTLERMRDQGRFQRYVVTTDKSGVFSVEATDKITRKISTLEANLKVCKNCLSKLKWRNFSDVTIGERNNIRDSFVIEDFFLEYSTFFHNTPKYTDKTAPRGGYAPDWSRISEEFRLSRNWRCDQCKVDLSRHRNLLHCHHKNGVVSDNSAGNISVLCILCHSEQPDHNHMKPRSKHRILIESLRNR